MGLIDFKTAVFIKKFGYNNSSYKEYWGDGKLHDFIDRYTTAALLNKRFYSAITYFEVVEWLWETGIAFISYSRFGNNFCKPRIRYNDKVYEFKSVSLRTPQEAYEFAVLKLIDIIKEEKELAL